MSEIPGVVFGHHSASTVIWECVGELMSHKETYCGGICSVVNVVNVLFTQPGKIFFCCFTEMDIKVKNTLIRYAHATTYVRTYLD